MTSAFSSKTLLALPCFILYSKAKLAYYSRYLLTFCFCIPVLCDGKDIFFGVSSRRSCLFYPNPTLLRLITLSRIDFYVSQECVHMAFIWCSSWNYNILTSCYVRLDFFFQSSLWYLLTKQTFSSPFSNVDIWIFNHFCLNYHLVFASQKIFTQFYVNIMHKWV